MIKSKQRGFTLIELVVVIVILGILSAFAVPKFMGMETQARISTVNAMAGTVRSTVAMAHGMCLATGCGATVTVNGTAYAMAFGYPTRASIIGLIDDSSAFTYVPATGLFTKIGAPTPATCSFVYTAATSLTVPPTITPTPINTAGC